MQHPKAGILIALLLLLLLLASETPACPGAAASPPGQWATLMSEDFEGAFPHGLWHIGKEGAPYLWGRRDCNPHGGRYSLWGNGGGSLGSQIACSGQYPANYVTTLSYGPLDLSDVAALRLSFAHWTWLGAGDSLGVGWSNDGGKTWVVLPIYGNAVSICGGWCAESFDQDRWTLPLAGQPKVYLLFRFASNATGVGYGSFLDDVSLEVMYGGALRSVYLPLVRR